MSEEGVLRHLRAWVPSTPGDTAKLDESLLLVVRKLASGAIQASPGEQAFLYWLASVADASIRELTGAEPAVLTFAGSVTASPVRVAGGLASAPAGMHGKASIAAPLPSETIVADRRPNLNHTYPYAGLVLLMVIRWLIIFAIPAVVKAENLSSDTQAMADVYDSFMAAFAVPITSAIIAKHKRK